MATDDERRRVAERLRRLVEDDSVYATVDACHVLYAIGLYYKDVDRIYFSGYDVARLADLIDLGTAEGPTSSDTTATHTDATATCDVSQSRRSDVDRGALLALAEDVEEAAAMATVMATVMDASEGYKLLAGLLLDIARRIREACGVVG